MEDQETPSNLILDSHAKNEETSEEEQKPFTRHHLKMSTRTGFEVGNWEEALEEKKKQSNRYYKGEEVSTFVDLSHFKMYGPGIYLFFSTLRDISLLFLLLSIVDLSPMIYNFVMGSTLTYSGTSLNVVATRFSIGAYLYDGT